VNKTSILLAIAIVATIFSGAAGWWLGSRTNDSDSRESAAEGERNILYWVAPMDSNYRADKPGKSPMGMDLVPVYADEEGAAGADQPSLRINPAVINNIGVKTVTAQRGTLYRDIETVGFITPDADRLEHIHIRAEGWIEKLAADTAGDRVEAGQVLFRIYSPALVSAQNEYLQALRSGQATLERATASRLRALGMQENQIDTLKSRGRARELFDVRSPVDGFVMQLNVRSGMYVQPGTTIMSLADLSTVWVDVDVFENQIDWVAPGQAARMKLPFAPEREWVGEVDYIYPTIRAESRTARVRLTFNNPDLALKPAMYASVAIDAAPRRGVVHVPSQAVIRTGDQERVILALGDGYFRPAEVLTGLESKGRVEILQGVAEDEQIVISSQFLIDSEASMDASLLRMIGQEQEQGQGQEAAEQTGNGMQGMDHSSHDMEAKDSDGENPEMDHSGHDMHVMEDAGEGQ